MSGCPFLLRASGFCGTNWVQIVAQISVHVTESLPSGNAAIGRRLDGGYMPNPWADHDFFLSYKRFKRISKSLNRLMI
jgi:hypothetical protein